MIEIVNPRAYKGFIRERKNTNVNKFIVCHIGARIEVVNLFLSTNNLKKKT